MNFILIGIICLIVLIPIQDIHAQEQFGPGRDNDVNILKNEVLDCLKNGGVFAVLVPLFFKNANISIDWVYKDLHNIIQNFKEKKNINGKVIIKFDYN